MSPLRAGGQAGPGLDLSRQLRCERVPVRQVVKLPEKVSRPDVEIGSEGCEPVRVERGPEYVRRRAPDLFGDPGNETSGGPIGQPHIPTAVHGYTRVRVVGLEERLDVAPHPCQVGS